jgi:hypothetical protein
MFSSKEKDILLKNNIVPDKTRETINQYVLINIPCTIKTVAKFTTTIAFSQT